MQLLDVRVDVVVCWQDYSDEVQEFQTVVLLRGVGGHDLFDLSEGVTEVETAGQVIFGDVAFGAVVDTVEDLAEPGVEGLGYRLILLLPPLGSDPTDFQVSFPPLDLVLDSKPLLDLLLVFLLELGVDAGHVGHEVDSALLFEVDEVEEVIDDLLDLRLVLLLRDVVV